MSAHYMYMWEFIVVPAHRGEFERAYGPDGEWAALFRRAPGYLRTELHRDRVRPDRYVTIDYWSSPADWEAFRAGFDEEFRILDERCASWTAAEREIGRFDPME